MLSSLKSRMCRVAVLMALVCCSLDGAPVRPVIRGCSGTMKLTLDQGMSRVTIDQPTTMVPADGGCSLEASPWNINENPVFDF